MDWLMIDLQTLIEYTVWQNARKVKDRAVVQWNTLLVDLASKQSLLSSS
jgi:hypothetical protein